MRHEIKKLPNSEIELELEASPEDLEPYLARAAETLSKERPVEGFRPGKVSLDLAKQTYGLRLYEKAVERLIEKEIPPILADENIQIVGRPAVQVKRLAPGNPVLVSLRSAVVPEFTLPDFDSIAKKVLKGKSALAVKPEEIEKAIEFLRNERKELKTVTRPAGKGDRVEIDLDITEQGVPIEGGKSEHHPLTLGEGRMVPGLEEHLVGMSAGEEKTFPLSIPENHHEKRIAGKTLDFAVKVSLVQEQLLPELDDAFAKSLGNFDSMEAVRNNIEEGILLEKTQKERDRIRVAIADAVAEKTEIPLPETLIQTELSKMAAELGEHIASMGMKLEDYLTHIKKSEADLKTEWVPDAKRRIKIALILKEIAKAKHIEPDAAAVEEEVSRALARFKSPEEAAREIDPASLRAYARTIARNEAVFQYLESL